jgi:DNA-directed RNA polymerase subunit RPC12/RpoP
MAEFQFSCPQCGQNIQCDTGYAGTQINCPVCRQAIVVPQMPRAATPPVPEKSRTLRNVLVITAAVVVLAGLVIGGWFGYSKYKVRGNSGQMSSGLVALWSGEGNAIDSVGGNNGKLAGNVTYASGKVGQAFVFDGKMNDSVKVGNPVQLQLQDFTIMAWIKRDNLQSVSADFRNGVIFGYGVGGYALYLNSVGHLILSKLNVRGGEIKPYAAIKDTDWHHLAVTKSGSTVVFYVDGIAHSAPVYDSEFVFSTDAAIGAAGDNSGDNFLGLIDEVGIYNRALSASEIQALYERQK